MSEESQRRKSEKRKRDRLENAPPALAARERARARYQAVGVNGVSRKQYAVDYRKKNPEKWLFWQAKSRAKKSGLEFTIELSDITVPEFCPVLGIRMETSEGGPFDNSPSLDRMNNSAGYVKGNVAVISMRANRIKRDASVEEIEAILKYMKDNASV